MPDPITGVGIAKAAARAASSDANQVAPGLVRRMLGPAADEIGEALRRYTSYRVGNVNRIVKSAERKSAGGQDGKIVHPRVAHGILDDGSYCDDELMADYYGGILASARTPDGRDDRAVSWSSLISGMSALQIRAHYLLYREWAARISPDAGLNLGLSTQRARAQMDVELVEFSGLLRGDSELDVGSLLSDAIHGLLRAGLLDNEFSYGPRSEPLTKNSPFENVVRVSPSPSGMELYGWAQGLPGLTSYEFPSMAQPFELEVPLPRLTRVALLQLEPMRKGDGDALAATAELHPEANSPDAALR
jgi:hypothetical protein